MGSRIHCTWLFLVQSCPKWEREVEDDVVISNLCGLEGTNDAQNEEPRKKRKCRRENDRVITC